MQTAHKGSIGIIMTVIIALLALGAAFYAYEIRTQKQLNDSFANALDQIGKTSGSNGPNAGPSTPIVFTFTPSQVDSLDGQKFTVTKDGKSIVVFTNNGTANISNQHDLATFIIGGCKLKKTGCDKTITVKGTISGDSILADTVTW